MQIDSSHLMQLGQLQQQQTGSRQRISALQAKAQAGNSGEDDRLKQACSDFQAIFIRS